MATVFLILMRIYQTLPFWTAHSASWTAQSGWTVRLEYADLWLTGGYNYVGIMFAMGHPRRPT